MHALSGKYAVVTGAAKGIGRAIAERFVQEDAAGVALIDLSAFDTLEIDPSRERVFSIACDIADAESVKRAFDVIYARFGRVDILVNNAGIIADAMFHKMRDDQWDRVMQVNIQGMYHCTKQVITRMREQNYGKIVNLSSTSAFGAVGQCNYSLTKSGVIGFTKSLAKESGRKSITVNAIAPDFIDTDMLRTIPSDEFEAACRQAPMQRPGKPEEVASLALFLASDESSYVSGECIRCGGALHT